MKNKFISGLAIAATIFSCQAFASPSIAINLPAHTLTLFDDGVRIASYPVAIGKYATPTPEGEYSIIDMGEDPVWTDPETMESVESGPWNPLGYRWMGFYGRYGIHGNSDPDSIGSSVSNGCVRMFNDDVETLYEYVDIGTPVKIYYDRLVVEQEPNNNIALYIYPDCYDEQEVTVADVNQVLNKYGYETAPFLSDAEIAAAIEEEEGEPVYVAKITNLFVNGKELTKKVYEKNGELFFPAQEISEVLGVAVPEEKTETRKGLQLIKGIAAVEEIFNASVLEDAKTKEYHVTTGEYREKALATIKPEPSKQEQKMEIKETPKEPPQEPEKEKNPIEKAEASPKMEEFVKNNLTAK